MYNCSNMTSRMKKQKMNNLHSKSYVWGLFFLVISAFIFTQATFAVDPLRPEIVNTDDPLKPIIKITGSDQSRTFDVASEIESAVTHITWVEKNVALPRTITTSGSNPYLARGQFSESAEEDILSIRSSGNSIITSCKVYNRAGNPFIKTGGYNINTEAGKNGGNCFTNDGIYSYIADFGRGDKISVYDKKGVISSRDAEKVVIKFDEPVIITRIKTSLASSTNVSGTLTINEVTVNLSEFIDSDGYTFVDPIHTYGAENTLDIEYESNALVATIVGRLFIFGNKVPELDVYIQPAQSLDRGKVYTFSYFLNGDDGLTQSPNRGYRTPFVSPDTPTITDEGVLTITGEAGDYFAILSKINGTDGPLTWVDQNTTSPISITTDSGGNNFARGRFPAGVTSLQVKSPDTSYPNRYEFAYARAPSSSSSPSFILEDFSSFTAEHISNNPPIPTIVPANITEYPADSGNYFLNSENRTQRDNGNPVDIFTTDPETPPTLDRQVSYHYHVSEDNSDNSKVCPTDNASYQAGNIKNDDSSIVHGNDYIFCVQARLGGSGGGTGVTDPFRFKATYDSVVTITIVPNSIFGQIEENGNTIRFLTDQTIEHTQQTSRLFTITTNPSADITTTSALILNPGAEQTCETIADTEYASTHNDITNKYFNNYSRRSGNYRYCVKVINSLSANTDYGSFDFVVTKGGGPTGPQAILQEDTGYSDTDGITNNGIFTVAISEEVASWTYSYKVNDVQITKNGDENMVGTGNTIIITDTGTIEIKVFTTDKYGETGEAGVVNSPVELDFVNPVPPSLSFDKSAETITIGDLETVSGSSWKYKLDDGSYVDGTSTTISTTSLSLESHTIYTQQTDVAGNISTEAQLDFSTAKPPVITPNSRVIYSNEGVNYLNIQGAEYRADGNAVPIFTVSANGSANIKYAVRSGSNVSSTQCENISNYPYTSIPTNQDSSFIADGTTYKICVKGEIEGAGVYVSFQYTVDRTLPSEYTVTGNPAVIQTEGGVNYLAFSKVGNDTRPLVILSPPEGVLSSEFNYSDIDANAENNPCSFSEYARDYDYFESGTVISPKDLRTNDTYSHQKYYTCFANPDAAFNFRSIKFFFTLVKPAPIKIFNAGINNSGLTGYVPQAESAGLVTFEFSRTSTLMTDSLADCTSAALTYESYTPPDIVYAWVTSLSPTTPLVENQTCFKATDFVGNISYKNSKNSEDGTVTKFLPVTANGEEVAGKTVDDIRYTKDGEISFTGLSVPNTQVNIYIQAHSDSLSWTVAPIEVAVSVDGTFEVPIQTFANGRYDIGASVIASGLDPTAIKKILDLEVNTSPPQPLTFNINPSAFIEKIEGGVPRYFITSNTFYGEPEDIILELDSEGYPDPVIRSFGTKPISTTGDVPDSYCDPTSSQYIGLLSRIDSGYSTTPVIKHYMLNRYTIGNVKDPIPDGRWANCFRLKDSFGNTSYKVFNFQVDKAPPNPPTVNLKDDTEDAEDLVSDPTLSISDLETVEGTQWSYDVYAKKTSLTLSDTTLTTTGASPTSIGTYSFPIIDQDASLIKENGKMLVRAVDLNGKLLNRDIEFSTIAGYGANLLASKGSLFSPVGSNAFDFVGGKIQGVYFDGNNIVISITTTFNASLSNYKDRFRFEIFYGHLRGSEYADTTSDTAEITPGAKLNSGERFTVIRQKDDLENTGFTAFKYILTLGRKQIPTIAVSPPEIPTTPILRIVGRPGDHFAIKTINLTNDNPYSAMWTDTDTSNPITITTDTTNSPYLARGQFPARVSKDLPNDYKTVVPEFSYCKFFGLDGSPYETYYGDADDSLTAATSCVYYANDIFSTVYSSSEVGEVVFVKKPADDNSSQAYPEKLVIKFTEPYVITAVKFGLGGFLDNFDDSNAVTVSGSDSSGQDAIQGLTAYEVVSSRSVDILFDSPVYTKGPENEIVISLTEDVSDNQSLSGFQIKGYPASMESAVEIQLDNHLESRLDYEFSYALGYASPDTSSHFGATLNYNPSKPPLTPPTVTFTDVGLSSVVDVASGRSQAVHNSNEQAIKDGSTNDPLVSITIPTIPEGGTLTSVEYSLDDGENWQTATITSNPLVASIDLDNHGEGKYKVRARYTVSKTGGITETSVGSETVDITYDTTPPDLSGLVITPDENVLVKIGPTYYLNIENSSKSLPIVTTNTPEESLLNIQSGVLLTASSFEESDCESISYTTIHSTHTNTFYPVSYTLFETGKEYGLCLGFFDYAGNIAYRVFRFTYTSVVHDTVFTANEDMVEYDDDADPQTDAKNYLNLVLSRQNPSSAIVTADPASNVQFRYKIVTADTSCDSEDYGDDSSTAYDSPIKTDDSFMTADGDYRVCVRSVNQYKNKSYANYDFTRDTVVPEGNNPFVLTGDSDSGVQGDNKTNDTTPNFEIESLENGETVKTYIYNKTTEGTDVDPEDLTIIAETGNSATIAFGNNVAISDLVDGEYDIRFQVRDAAGNVSALENNSLIITIDTTPPSIPLIPNLIDEDDTFGKYNNTLRVGTNTDNITNKINNLHFTLTSGNDNDDDNYQIFLYRIPVDVFAEGDEIDRDTLEPVGQAPENPYTANVYDVTNFDANTNKRVVETYTSDTIIDEERVNGREFYFVALQTDEAGNFSDIASTPVYTLTIDNTPPISWFNDLEISSNVQTTATDITFGSDGRSQSAKEDLEYYAILLRRQIVEEDSGNLIDDPNDVAFDPTSSGYKQGTILVENEDGYSVNIPYIDLGIGEDGNSRSYDAWYQVTAFAVDRAGNMVQGIDTTQIKFLEIPKKITNLRLLQSDDTGVSNSDGITNVVDGWQISGQFGKTNGEKIAGSETAVDYIELTILYGDNTPKVIPIEKPSAGEWGVVSGTSGENTIYEFSKVFEFDEEILAQDGEYQIRVQAFDDGGLHSPLSDILNIQLDTVVPTESELASFVYVYNPTLTAGNKHAFTITRNADSDVGDVSIYDDSTAIEETPSYDLVDSDQYTITTSASPDKPFATVTYKLKDRAGNESDSIQFPETLTPSKWSVYRTDNANSFVALDTSTQAIATSDLLSSSATCGVNTVEPTPYVQGSEIETTTGKACFTSLLTEGIYQAYAYQSSVNAQDPLISEFGIVSDDDTAAKGDRITKTTSVRLMGTAVAGTTGVRIINSDGDDLPVEVESDETFQTEVVDLQEGRNNFFGYVTDANGVEVGPLPLLPITLDTQAPATASTFIFSSDLFTFTTPQYLNKEKKAKRLNTVGISLGTTVTTAGIFDSFALVESTVECDDTSSYTNPITNEAAGLTEGSQKICIQTTDAAGNSVYGSSLEFVVDTTPPVVSIIKAGVANGNEGFVAAAEDLTTTIMHSFQTTVASSAASVDCSVQTPYISYKSPVILRTTGGNNPKQLCFAATDVAGNKGYKNSKEGEDGVAGLALSDTSIISSVVESVIYVGTTSIGLSGITPAGATVHLYKTERGTEAWAPLLPEFAADATTGQFTTDAITLPQGEYDIAGSITPVGETVETIRIKLLSITIDTVKLPTLTLDSNAAFTNTNRQTIYACGLSIADSAYTDSSKVKFYDGDFFVTDGTITIVDNGGECATGKVIRLSGHSFANGENSITVTIDDYAGNTSDRAIPFNLFIDTTAPVQTSFPFTKGDGELYTRSFTFTDITTISIAGTTVPYSFTQAVRVPAGAAPGVRRVSDTSVTDAGGNTVSLRVRVDNQAPTVSVREQFNVSNKRKPYLEVTVARNQASVFATEEEILTPVFAGKCSDFSVIEGQYISTSNDSADYTITINSPSSETYDDCTIQFTDEAGNLSNAITLDSFRIASSGGSGGGNGSRSIKAPEIVTNGDEVIETPTEEEVVTDKAPALPTTQETLLFTKPLKLGDEEKEVKQLQQFLNNQGFTVTDQGAGSPGQETEYFGPATKRALEQYQEAYKEEILTPLGLSAPTGVLGPATIQHIQEQTEQPIPEEEVIIIQQPDRGDTTTGTITMLRKAINALLERITTLRTQKQEDVDERERQRERQVEIEKQAVIETERREEFDRFIDLNIDSAFRYPDSLSAPSIQTSTPPLPIPPLPIEVLKPAERKVEEKRQPFVQPTQGTILQESTIQPANLPSRVFSAPEAYSTNDNVPTSSQDDVPQEKDQKVENQQSVTPPGGEGFQGSFFPRVKEGTRSIPNI